MKRPGFRDVPALVRCARLALEAGDVETADLASAIAIERAPENAEAWFARGIVRAQQMRMRDAKNALLRAAFISTERADIWCALAEAYLELNTFPEAAWALRKCIALDPEMKTPHGTRARLLVVKAQKRLRQA